MKKKPGLGDYILYALLFLLAFLFIVKEGGPALLKSYFRSGIGDCKKIPILCMQPSKEIKSPSLDYKLSGEFIPHKFPKISISVPRGFMVVQERVKKVYYKRNNRRQKGSVIYLLYKEPGFFVNLFPQAKKEGIGNNYEFFKRVMHANPDKMRDTTDLFFAVIKSIFIPDMGDQKTAVMSSFALNGRRGFINYNLGERENYFDCNIIDSNDNFFKVYIKDKNKQLDLGKAMLIISTVEG